MPESENALLYLHALTGLHPGSGTALGVVDLPVQRERHTQWPTIPGSTLKGILRSVCRGSDSDPRWLATFGPEPGQAHEHAGALSITDARILAFPVRSLSGVFAWVTCPSLLHRLVRDLGIAGQDATGLGEIPKVNKENIFLPKGSPLLLKEGKVLLEEFEFTRAGEADGIAQWIAGHATDDAGTAERIKSHLTVLHDDDFTHFVEHATEVVARIGLDYDSKTVRDGALFYEEFLPPETLFYALAFTVKSRKADCPMTGGEILDDIRRRLPKVIQIGADETIGKGLCGIRLDTGEEMA